MFNPRQFGAANMARPAMQPAARPPMGGQFARAPGAAPAARFQGGAAPSALSGGVRPGGPGGSQMASQMMGQRTGPAPGGAAPVARRTGGGGVPLSAGMPRAGGAPNGLGGGMPAGGNQMAGMGMAAQGMMMSDKHSKEEIQRLEGANDALSRALSTSVEHPDTSKPSSGLQALGQQNSPPSHASFPDAPQQPSPMANKVAAQNQVMAPAAGQQPGNPHGVQLGMPDLSALDEAYKNAGRNYGG